MKIIDYVGTEGSSIVIEKPEDLYPFLDWFHSQIIEIAETREDAPEYWKCADFVSDLMDKAEEAGYGSYDSLQYVKS